MTVIAWLDRDNTIDITLYDDDVLINHAIITRILLIFDTQTIDSQSSASMFVLGNSDKIVFKPFSANLIVGSYDMRIITYDASNTNGVIWGDDRVQVMQG